jgi:APA family basic amino acid/polyamine antiporter
MRGGLGDTGGTLIAAGIVASTFGFLNFVILAAPRVYQAMAADGLFLAAAARLHPRFRTPAAAIAFQAVWAIILLRTGKYGPLVDYVTFADWTFFGLSGVSLLVLRRRDARRGAPRPFFVAPLRSLAPLVFGAASIYVVLSAAFQSPRNVFLGALIMLSGVGAYFLWRRRGAAMA